jgi:hypothetical protein
MTIDYSIPGKVQFTMNQCIEKMLEEAPSDMDGIAITPAADHLFTVNNKPTLLSTKDGGMFHHLTAKLLHLSKRARPDIQTAVAFLITRVRASDEDDRKKLGRVIKYLRGCPDLPLTLDADDMCMIRWWVDGSFAVHPDMKSHTGAVMPIGKGTLYRFPYSGSAPIHRLLLCRRLWLFIGKSEHHTTTPMCILLRVPLFKSID